MTIINHTLGFPRVGLRRELKKAQESYWAGNATREELLAVGRELRARHWEQQKQAGVDLLPVGDFAWYDHVLTTSLLLGNVPARHQNKDGSIDIDTLFRIGRGRAPTGEPAAAAEMTKWFNTNYHYMVPEFVKGQQFKLTWTQLLEEVDERALPDDVRARIDAVHAQRAAVSQDFFARAADKFQAQQDLIAGLPQYRESVLALLDALAFAPGATALEVGPGDGGFLPELARRFRQVTALDNSAAMLELARQRCKEEGLGNVRLELADALQDAAEPADCVVLNMVLHHFAAPAEALKQLARLVHPGGSLLVTDLCRHNQGWAREACGDLWLGFEQEDLAQWADAAGLTPGESLYIGLRNGFQIQVRHFARDASESRLTHR